MLASLRGRLRGGGWERLDPSYVGFRKPGAASFCHTWGMCCPHQFRAQLALAPPSGQLRVRSRLPHSPSSCSGSLPPPVTPLPWSGLSPVVWSPEGHPLVSAHSLQQQDVSVQHEASETPRNSQKLPVASVCALPPGQGHGWGQLRHCKPWGSDTQGWEESGQDPESGCDGNTHSCLRL